VIPALLLIPAVGAAVALLLRSDRLARWFGVLVTAATFGVSIALLPGTGGRVSSTVDARHAVDLPWIPALDVRFHVGVDGVSTPLVVLTTLLCLLCAVYTLTSLPAPGRAPAFTALVLLT